MDLHFFNHLTGKVKKKELDFHEDFENYFSKETKLSNFLLQQQEEEERELLLILVSSNEPYFLKEKS